MRGPAGWGRWWPTLSEGAALRGTLAGIAQNDLSDMLGVSRQSLSVELKKLERQALIRIAHAKVVVTDPGGLARHGWRIPGS